MDPLTHGVVGALAAQSFAGKEKVRTAALAGFPAGMLADLDFFIHNPSDPLLNIELHRQFTHSLLFIPAGALIAALLLWWLLRKRLRFGELYLFSFVSYATAGLLDACTSYGTVLLWPLNDTRVAWNLISIVDPLFTVVLVLLLAAAWRTGHRHYAWSAGLWLLLYLSFGFLQQERATHALHALADERGHVVERAVVKPTVGNLLLWRGTYESDGELHADALRAGLFGKMRIYEGASAPLIRPEHFRKRLGETRLFGDLIRFSRLSDGWLVRHPEDPDVIGDARYSMLPTSLIPLWGIRVDTANADDHAPLLYYREAGPEIREPFLRMLTGRDPADRQGG